MPIYKFRALDKSWKREVGTITADSFDHAATILRVHGLRPESIQAVRPRSLSGVFAKVRRHPLLALSALTLPIAPLLMLKRQRQKKDHERLKLPEQASTTKLTTTKKEGE